MSYQAGILQDSNMLANTIGSNIQKITQLTGEIQRSVNNLGSALDSPELREQLQQKKQQVHQLVKVTDRYIKDFSSLPVTTEQRQRKLQKDRLVNDFSNALAAFQRTQRQAAQKEKEFVARVRASSRISAGSEDVGYGNPFQSESQYQSQSQSQSQDVSITVEDLQIIQERESSIRQLESDIIDINDIFKDLAMMVHEQGDMIDSIEANVESADVSVQSATQQLAQAANYQSKSRKKICILLVVLVVLAVVVGLIIWASVQS